MKKIFVNFFRNRISVFWYIASEISGMAFILTFIVFVGKTAVFFKTGDNGWSAVGYFIIMALMGCICLEKITL